jgi:nitrogen regulatory protein P-II 1
MPMMVLFVATQTRRRSEPGDPADANRPRALHRKFRLPTKRKRCAVKMIVAMIRPHKIDEVKLALTEVGVQGMSVAEIKGFGRTGGKTEVFRGSAYHVDFVPKLRIEVVVTEAQVHPVLQALEKSAKTGKVGDGKVFVLPVEETMRIRTGERGEAAI